MLDTKVITEMIEKQIAETVSNHVSGVLTSDEWATPIEEKIIKYTQDRILSKFANSTAMPELIETVKTSVSDLFASGHIPGVSTFVDNDLIKRTVDIGVENLTQLTVSKLFEDPAWLEKIESIVNQAVVRRTMMTVGSIDISTIIHQRVDENMAMFKRELLEGFSSTGIDDKATKCQLTIMDDTTVIENTLTAYSAHFVDSVTVKDLAVTGSINTDNRSWDTLAANKSEKTLAKLDQDWKDKLVIQVAEEIKTNGINFKNIKVDDQPLVVNGELAKTITQSRLRKVGKLENLIVDGETSLNKTVIVVKNRLGVNTDQPDAALNVWDEEISVSISKYKNQEAYIGTNRNQALNIGINKTPQITIGVDGITVINKLRVAQYMISHGTTVPGYAGTKGDIVFNVNPVPNSPFAWVCLGSYQWKVLKAVE